jgi:hypothetical protein
MFEVDSCPVMSMHHQILSFIMQTEMVLYYFSVLVIFIQNYQKQNTAISLVFSPITIYWKIQAKLRKLILYNILHHLQSPELLPVDVLIYADF